MALCEGDSVCRPPAEHPQHRPIPAGERGLCGGRPVSLSHGGTA